MGLKLHEDWGTTPAAIDNCLTVAEQYDIQAQLSSIFSLIYFCIFVLNFYYTTTTTQYLIINCV
jgi:hypothetical protein